MKKAYPGDAIKNMVWKCAKSSYMNQWEAEMEALKTFDEGAHKWLRENTSAKHWSRAYFRENIKCDMLLNNHSESFNRQILSARTKPILGMLEKIKVYLMLRLQSRRSSIDRHQGSICPRIMRIVEKLKEQSAFCFPSYAGGSKFQVREMNNEQFCVDTNLKQCSCRKWQLTGIPCKHGISALGLQGLRVEDCVDKLYSTETYQKAYEPIIGPTNGPNNWPKCTYLPPLMAPKNIRLPGRPKMKRRLEEGEKPYKNQGRVQKMRRMGFSQNKCKKCGENGHNTRTCAQQGSLNSTQTQVAPEIQIAAQAISCEPQLEHVPSKKAFRQRKCGLCGTLGHNRSTCKHMTSMTTKKT